MKKFLLILFLFSSFWGFSQSKTENYISEYSSAAVDEMNRYSIPASITLAQGILESGNGESRLATEGNNHFGIKCHSNWNGKTIIEDDDEKGECFRKYDKVTDSYRDHSLFLTERGRYSFLFEYKKSDYKKWAKGLKKAGYATNPNYPTLLIDLIERYELYTYDKGEQSDKQLYFAHTYGLPYLTGLGAFYFSNKSVFFTEVNTSFVFSGANLGYHYELFNKFYIGANAGVIYLPTEDTDIIPQLSAELMYKKSSENKRYNSVLIRGGVQLPLDKMDYKLIPYLSLSYLIN
ncbi:MAG: glucosaminidase domain-containing protein [Cryomorphaceae bacterium]|nr:glucosaminidase domain-containing protein [Cryomorphaceae bacterium]